MGEINIQKYNQTEYITTTVFGFRNHDDYRTIL